MKTFARWVLGLVLVATPTMVTRDLASANTELVPASRLVAPFVSSASTRPTFLLLTNVTTLNLQGTKGSSFDGSVHIEFYNKACARTDKPEHLSSHDIDQINVVASDLGTETTGWVDIDVRTDDSATSTSIQQNALLGTVVITDSVSDFALSYPMASSLGSSGATTGGGSGGNIVTRDTSDGLANVWSGRYEPFATRIFVPGFYAEGGGTAVGAITESLLAIASPADGNWWGGTGGWGEAPGQDLPSTTLINMTAIQVYDGCETPNSRSASGHYVVGSLVSLFGALLDRAAWTSGNCTTAAFPGLDELSGSPVGWIDLPNISCSRTANHNFAAVSSACSSGGGTGPATATTGKRRGVVGLLFEVAVVKGGGTDRGADTSRLWGDPSSITAQTGCLTTQGVSSECRYSLTPISIP